MVLIVTLMLILTAEQTYQYYYGGASKSRKEEALENCKHQMTLDKIDWTSYYGPGADRPSQVDILQIKDEAGEYKCALYLEDCGEACGCGHNVTILCYDKENDNWNINCMAGMAQFSGPSARSLDTEEDDDFVMDSNNGYSGSAPASSIYELNKEISEAQFDKSIDLFGDRTTEKPEPRARSLAQVSAQDPVRSEGNTEEDESINDLANAQQSHKNLLCSLNPEDCGVQGVQGRSLEFESEMVATTLAQETTTKNNEETTTATERAVATDRVTETDTSTTATESDLLVESSTTTSEVMEETTTEEMLEETTTEQEEEAEGLEGKKKIAIDDVGSLQTKYYVVVAFVIVFVVVLVIIGIVIFIKMKESRSGHAIISPGPGDHEPLTPSHESGGAFKFDETS